MNWSMKEGIVNLAKGLCQFIGGCLLVVVCTLLSPVAIAGCLLVFCWPMFVLVVLREWIGAQISDCAMLFVSLAACALWWIWLADQKQY